MFFPEIDGVVEKDQFRSVLNYPVILGHSIAWHP